MESIVKVSKEPNVPMITAAHVAEQCKIYGTETWTQEEDKRVQAEHKQCLTSRKQT